MANQQEPTPEFNERCLAVIQQWSSGALPYAEASQALIELGREAARDDLPVDQGRVEQLLGYMLGYRGRLNDAIYHYERARAHYARVNNQRRMAICDLNMGEAFRYKGDFKRARRLFERAYETFSRTADLESQAMAIGNKGQMLLSLGQIEAARADLLEGRRLALQIPPDSLDRSGLLCEIHHALTALYLQTGDLDSAKQEALAAYQIAQAAPQPLERGFANRAIAEILTAGVTLSSGFAADPDHYYRVANEAFQEIHAEGEMARTMFLQARSLARRGRRMTAARKLQLAMVIFSRLGMVDDAARAAEAQLEMIAARTAPTSSV